MCSRNTWLQGIETGNNSCQFLRKVYNKVQSLEFEVDKIQTRNKVWTSKSRNINIGTTYQRPPTENV